MRVVIVHNRYRSGTPSGENRVVEQDIALLRSAGLEVLPYLRDSDEIAQYGARERLALVGRPVVSFRALAELDQIFADFRPDVVHLHNVFPLVSPAVIRLARARGIATVQTVHNYRHSCPAGTHYRAGQLCHDCSRERVAVACVRHGCYRGSRIQSAIMAGALALHRRSFERLDRLLPVSRFVATRLIAAGFAASQVVVHPNSVPDPGEPAPMGDGFAFLGRLEQSKGIELLMHAWLASGLDGTSRLVVAGDGPLRSQMEDFAASCRSVDYRGAVSAQEAGAIIDESAAVVVPSLWYEALPLVVLEAFSRGRPAVVSDLGSLASVVDGRTGLRFTPSVQGLADALVAAHAPEFAHRGQAARLEYLANYTPQCRVDTAIKIYRDVAGR